MAIQQLNLRSGHDCHQEVIAESGSDNIGFLINSEPTNNTSSVTTALQSTNVEDPQPSDLWKIRGIIGTRKVNGVVQYCWNYSSVDLQLDTGDSVS